MKKIIAILLSAVLMLSLAACSAKEEKDPTNEGTDTAVESTSPSEEETTLPEKEPDVITFAGAMVVDNEYCRIDVTEISENSIGTSLTVEVENKTKDMNLFFTTKSCSINGVYVDAVLGENIAAGKKAKSSVTFLDDALKENGITKYTDIEITFRVYDADNWGEDDLVVKTFNIYPYGENKAETFVREDKATDITVIDTDKASATVTSLDEDDPFGYALNLYLENKSADTNYMFAVSGCAVNGVEVLNLGAFSVPAGNVAFDKLYITDAILEENGITDFSDIYLKIRVFDSDSWDPDDVAEQGVHIYPKGQDKAEVFVRDVKATDRIIADNEDITVIITGMSEDDLLDTEELCFYFINKTNEDIMFSMQEVSVNDFKLDPFFSVTVQPGFSKFHNASWFEDDLEENGIDDIEKIEFTMVATDPSDYDKPDYMTEKVIYNP